MGIRRHCACAGYYIHSCPKMRYKGDFQPSELLCMEAMRWVPFQLAAAGLDLNHQCILSQVWDCPGTTALRIFVHTLILLSMRGLRWTANGNTFEGL